MQNIKCLACRMFPINANHAVGGRRGGSTQLIRARVWTQIVWLQGHPVWFLFGSWHLQVSIWIWMKASASSFLFFVVLTANKWACCRRTATARSTGRGQGREHKPRACHLHQQQGQGAPWGTTQPCPMVRMASHSAPESEGSVDSALNVSAPWQARGTLEMKVVWN